mmetsp:Transcript_21912/g.21096  ORF Transcript_21912/g.21096 Transcript_21912/m.21096 type:complete len:116 (-) Transcript_21912:671-1018(-)
MLMGMVIFSVIIERDEVLMNKAANQYSLVPLEGYRTFSQIIKEDKTGLVWNPVTKILDQGTAPTMQFEVWKKLMLNKDEHALVEERKNFEDKLATYSEIFLDGSQDLSKVLLASL